MIKNPDEVDVFIGVDLRKSIHQAVAIDPNGKKVLHRALPQNEGKIRAIIRSDAGKGRVLIVVDQYSIMDVPPVAAVQAEGVMLWYIPTLALRRIADLHPGEPRPGRQGRCRHCRSCPGLHCRPSSTVPESLIAAMDSVATVRLPSRHARGTTITVLSPKS